MSAWPVPAGHYRVDVVVYLTTNQNDTTIALTKKLEHVAQVWINEYEVLTPNGGAIAPCTWRLILGDNGFTECAYTNAPGRGFPLIVDNASIVHVVYDTPRVISNTWKGTVNELRVQVQAVTNSGATVTVAPATFVQATFMLSFICKDATTSIERTMLEDRSLPQSAYGQYVTRAPWQHQ